MDPQTPLAVFATALAFLLKTSLGFCLCWLLSKVVTTPKSRFSVWFGFLIAASFYWVWLAISTRGACSTWECEHKYC